MSRIIPVRVFAFRPDSELAQARLRAAGIESILRTDDASGLAPHVGMATGGIALLVDHRQHGEAQRVLRQADFPDRR